MALLWKYAVLPYVAISMGYFMIATISDMSFAINSFC
nr:MAG TPA: hypothetical protein [Caudoviricetes sp.]